MSIGSDIIVDIEKKVVGVWSYGEVELRDGDASHFNPDSVVIAIISAVKLVFIYIYSQLIDIYHRGD